MYVSGHASVGVGIRTTMATVAGVCAHARAASVSSGVGVMSASRDVASRVPAKNWSAAVVPRSMSWGWVCKSKVESSGISNTLGMDGALEVPGGAGSAGGERARWKASAAVVVVVM